MSPHAARDRSIAALYRRGLTLEVVGDTYGLTRERVRQILAKLGVERRHRIHYTPEQLNRASYRYWKRDPIAKVAAVLGCSADTARDIMRREGRHRGPRPKPPHGTDTRYAYHGCRCRTCRRANTDRHLSGAHDRVGRGICRNCSTPAAPERTMCEKHLARLRRENALRAERRAA